MGDRKILILVLLIFGNLSTFQAQTYHEVLTEIDAAIQSHESEKAYQLIYDNQGEVQDSLRLLEFRLRELLVLEQMELYDETIQLANKIIEWPEIPTEQLVEVFLVKALVYEILGDLPKTRIYLDNAKHRLESDLYVSNPNSRMIGRYYIRESSYFINLYRTSIDPSDFNHYQAFAKKALKFSDKYDYPNVRAEAIMLLSFNPNLGLKERKNYLNQSLQWWKKAGNNYSVSAMYNNIAMLNLNDVSIAKRYNDSAFMVFSEINSPSIEAYSYETRYRLFDRLGNSDSALSNFIRFKELSDKVDFSRRMISVERIDREANLEKAKLKNHLLKDAILTEQKNNEVLVIVAIVLILFSLVFIYLYLKLSDRKRELTDSRKILSRNLEEKTLLLAELNHRVKNNLSLILSLMQLQRSRDKRKEQDWNQLESRINTMAMAHSLYSYSNENISGSTINLKSYLKDIIKSYESMSDQQIRFNIEISSVNVSVENALPIGIIFNELVSNSIKHAIVENDNLEIQFKVNLEENIFKLVYNDNGIKFIESDKPSTGQYILNALTKQLNGAIHRDQSRYEITLYKK